MNRMETPGKATRAPAGAKGHNYMKTSHLNIKYMFDDERGQHLITYEIFLPGGITDNNNIKIHLRESKKGPQTLVVVHPLPPSSSEASISIPIVRLKDRAILSLLLLATLQGRG